MDIPAWFPFMRQFSMVIFSDGLFIFQPSSFSPDFIAMASSPVVASKLVILIFLLESITIPSVLGPVVDILTPWTEAFSE